MTGETEHATRSVGVWGGGIVGGLVGGVGMGIVLHAGALIPILGVLVGDPTARGGWIVHLLLSVFFGLVFAAIVSRPALAEFTETFPSYLGFGFAYGVVLGLFAGGFPFPFALDLLGASTFPVPFLPLPGIAAELLAALSFTVAHLVYGLLLGAVYAAVNGLAPETVTERVPAIGR
ncbi:hypothetical protein ACFOZ7_14470 [Natribaculum luteum]|uniref:Histidine kinase n=1 Tax=Natribaculum luteum TaxID=1586232 RepID=A0ABD5P1D5_9EURY|nr:hypothetical protein [Natribaculum luteum]